MRIDDLTSLTSTGSTLNARNPSSVWVLVAAAGFVLLWFIPLGWRDLITPDEGRYAELALGMFRSGDWITPRLNGILYFQKPPLQYWATALAYGVFGVNEFSARLWPGLMTAVAVLAIGCTGARLYGLLAGYTAAAVLASSLLWVGNGHFLTLDAGLSGFLALVMSAFLLAHDGSTPEHLRRRFMLAAWAAMAFAVLGKGLIGVVIPAATLTLYVLVTRDWRLPARLHMRWGFAMLLTIAAPWFIVVSMRNPGFAQFFFIHEHFARYTSQVHGRAAPWWTFLVLVPFGLLPWLAWLPQAVRGGWQVRSPGFRSGLFLLLWTGFVIGFFSLSGSKLPSYILPVYPALALLIGRAIANPASRDPRKILWIFAGLASLLTFAAPIAAKFYSGSAVIGGTHREFAYWIAVAAALLALAMVAGLFLLARRTRYGTARLPAVLVIASLSLISTLVAMSGHQVYAQTKSSKELVAAVAPHLTPVTALYAVRYYDQSLPFYFDRPLTLVDYRDEFTMGLAIEPELGIASLSEFVDRWQHKGQAIAVLQRPVLRELQEQGLSARVLYEDPRRVVIATP